MITQNYSRRKFIKQSLAAGTLAMMLPDKFLSAASKSIKIAEIEVFPVVYPMTGRFKFFEDPQGNRIGRSAAIVKITADNGIVGWGESVPIPRWSYETLETVTSTIRHYYRPILIGTDIFDLYGAHKLMNSVIAPSFSTGQPIARAGIDIALHDLIGKSTHQNLPQLWGRKSVDKIKLSWTVNPKNLAEVDSLIDDGWQKGYRHFNVKVSPDPQFDIELCRQVKKRVPEGFLWADANGGYDLATALKVAPKLADTGVDILEQPLPPNRIAGYLELKKQGALPIIIDEGVVSPATLIEFIRLGMLDGVAMKPARCGGLVSARRQIEIILDAGLMFLGSGLTDPDISLAATLALYGAFQYKLPAALNGPQFITKSVLKNPLSVENGYLSVPTGEGLGIEVDEQRIKEIMVKI